jgi:hypothetical protein
LAQVGVELELRTARLDQQRPYRGETRKIAVRRDDLPHTVVDAHGRDLRIEREIAANFCGFTDLTKRTGVSIGWK